MLEELFLAKEHTRASLRRLEAHSKTRPPSSRVRAAAAHVTHARELIEKEERELRARIEPRPAH